MTRVTRRVRAPRAFSLIEVALAAAILLLGLAGLASALPQLSHVQEHQRHLADAGTVAGNVLEEAIQMQDAGTLRPGVVIARYSARGLADPVGMYTATRTVTANNPLESGRMLQVVVLWDEFGRAKNYTLKTYAYVSP